MQGNNNNNPDWKKKLDGLENLPAEDFNLNASWEKLETRREKAPRKSNAGLYWLAAACLFAVIGLPFLFHSKTNIEPLVKQNVPVKNIEQPPTNGQPDTKNIIAVAPLQEIKEIAKKPNRPVISSKRNETVFKNDSIVKDVEPVLAIIQSPVTDTFKLIAAAPVKKKLKVVPYNELVSSTDSLTGDSRPYFPVKFRTKEIYTNNTGSGKDNLIRIKLSSQN